MKKGEEKNRKEKRRENAKRLSFPFFLKNVREV